MDGRQEIFLRTYGNYLRQVRKIAELYAEAAEVRDEEEIQHLRERLEIGRIKLGPSFVSDALQYWQEKENDRKECEARRTIDYRRQVGKGENHTYATAKEAENQAFLDCSTIRTQERDAEHIYRKIREIDGYTGGLINAMASRLRQN